MSLTFEQAAAHFNHIADTLEETLLDAAEQGLRDVVALLEPATPRRKGLMARDYDVIRSGRQTLLVNYQWYAPLVIDGTRRSRPNITLRNILDNAQSALNRALDLEVERRYGDWR